MKILVIGGSQGTGALLVKRAIAAGHEVTAFARSPEKLAFDGPKLTKLKGDFHEKSSVTAAVKGHDVVVITASATSLSAFKDQPYYFSKGTAYVIEAMKADGVRRLVVLSALGTGDSRSSRPWLVRKILLDWILKLPMQDHDRQESQVMASNLEWVIARPGRLTNKAGKKTYKKTTGTDVPNSIARDDVADFLLEAATTNTWIKKAVQIGG